MQGKVTEFLKPRIVDVQSVNDRTARVVLEPLERGFGHTLGNALRRILLSSMPGCAITGVEIDGVAEVVEVLELAVLFAGFDDGLGRLLAKVPMDFLHVAAGGDAAADGRLVGDDDAPAPVPVQPAKRLQAVGKKPELGPVLDAGLRVPVDDPVAVEENDPILCIWGFQWLNVSLPHWLRLNRMRRLSDPCPAMSHEILQAGSGTIQPPRTRGIRPGAEFLRLCGLPPGWRPL